MKPTKQPVATLAPGASGPAYDLPAEPIAYDPPAPRAAAKPRQLAPGLYDKAGLTLAYLGALAVAAAMWAAGGFFTLTAFGIAVGGGWLLAWWLLPAAITGIEIWLMPRAGVSGRLVALFGLVLALDVASSWYGVIEWGAGRFIRLGPGFTLPKGGPGLHIIAVLAGLILAFYPEKLARKAWAELLKVWR